MEFTNSPQNPVNLLSLQAFQVFQQANHLAKLQRFHAAQPSFPQVRETKSTTNKRANPYMEQNISNNITKKIKNDSLYGHPSTHHINPMLLTSMQQQHHQQSSSALKQFQYNNMIPSHPSLNYMQPNPNLMNQLASKKVNDSMLDVLCEQLEGECNNLMFKIQDLVHRKEKIYSQRIKGHSQISEDETGPETPDFSIKSEGSFKVEYEPKTLIKHENLPHGFEGFFLKTEVKEEHQVNHSIKKPHPKTPKSKGSSAKNSVHSSPDSKKNINSHQNYHANPLVYQKFF